MSANSRQVGGAHYGRGIQHWDYVISKNIPYLEAMVIKYVERHSYKNGLQDLEKAMHFIEKAIEVYYSEGAEPESQGYVNQDQREITRNEKVLQERLDFYVRGNAARRSVLQTGMEQMDLLPSVRTQLRDPLHSDRRGGDVVEPKFP